MPPSPLVPAARRRIRLAWAALTLLTLFSVAIVTPAPSRSRTPHYAPPPPLTSGGVPLAPRTTLDAAGRSAIVVPDRLTPIGSAGPELSSRAVATMGAAPPARSAEPPLPLAQVTSATAGELQLALDRARRASGVNGLSFAVVGVDGVGWAGTSGTMRDGTTPLAADQPLVIGSVTKTFVAALVMQLVEEGVLRLDQRVSDFLPDLPLVRYVTVQQLLDHTSGIPDLYGPLHRKLQTQQGRIWSPTALMRHMGSRWFYPGTGWAYSNTNYYLLGLVVQEATGRAVEDLLEERLFTPLGLPGATLPTAEQAPAIGMDPAWSTAFWTSGAMVASATDLARWGELMYEGHVLERDSLRRMLSFNEHHYGLGAQRMRIGRYPTYGHSGLLYNYTTLMVYLPQQRITLAIIANRSSVNLNELITAEVNGDTSLLALAFRFAARD